MSSDATGVDITELLHRWSDGDAGAFEKLVPIVYDELRRLAQHVVRKEGPAPVMARTALVHELYLKLIAQDRAQWRDRQQFFGIAVKMMRRLMIDEARQRLAVKRGAGASHVTVEDALDHPAGDGQAMIAVDEALTRFAAFDPERSKIVELRYFGGMDLDEIAELMQVSRSTVKRHWSVARMWLHRELSQAAR
jgi:RNA polymerase sigma factor (TIGR02999 family)